MMKVALGTGLLLLLACEEQVSYVPHHIAQHGVKVYATELAKIGLTSIDLIDYRTTSMATIIKITDVAGIGVAELAKLSGIQVRAVQRHLRGERILSAAFLNKLQAGLRQAIDSAALENYRNQYHHELIDRLPQILKIERAVVGWQKMTDAGKLQDDDFYTAYVEDVVAVREEGIAAAVARLKPKGRNSQIVTVLQKYGVTADDFDNYEVTSTAVLQKILRATGVTYGKNTFMHNHAQLVLHILGKKTITDNTVAKIRVFVEQTLIEGKTAQQHGKDEATRQIEGVFRELDHALRVERTARSLYKKPQLLDATWKKRVNQVLAKRNSATTTPLRHSTSWERITAYDKSSRVIFLEIIDTLHEGGWLLPFNEGTGFAMFNDFMRGEYLMSDTSQQKIKDEIKKTLVEEPANTGTTKQATVEKLKVLLPKFNAALRVEKALHEMQQDIGSLSQTMQQHVQRALAIRDEHLMLTRFRVTWDDVKIFDVSSVTAIREILVTLNLSSNRIAMHTSLSHSVVSDHLRGVRNLTPTSVAELIRFLCATIAASELPAEKAAALRGKAIHLHKLTRVEKAALELLKDDAQVALLLPEQEEMLRRVLTIKKEALAAR